MACTPILATLVYVLSPDRMHVLMIHRNTRPDDHAFGKYNGLGGKMEVTEDLGSSLCREVREEAGIEVLEYQLRGTVLWPGFGKQGEDWFGFIFLVTGFRGEPVMGNHEGTLEWVPLSRLLAFNLNLWGGDHYFLPMVFDTNDRPFHGVMPYEGGHPVRWSFTR